MGENHLKDALSLLQKSVRRSLSFSLRIMVPTHKQARELRDKTEHIEDYHSGGAPAPEPDAPRSRNLTLLTRPVTGASSSQPAVNNDELEIVVDGEKLKIRRSDYPEMDGAPDEVIIPRSATKLRRSDFLVPTLCSRAMACLGRSENEVSKCQSSLWMVKSPTRRRGFCLSNTRADYSD